MKLTDAQTQALYAGMSFIEKDLHKEALRHKKAKSSGILNTLKSWMGYGLLSTDESDVGESSLEAIHTQTTATLDSFEKASRWSQWWHWGEIQHCKRWIERHDALVCLQKISPLRHAEIQPSQKNAAVKTLQRLSTQWHYFSKKRKVCLSLASVLDGEFTMESAMAKALLTYEKSLTLDSEEMLSAWLLEQESAFLAYGQRKVSLFSNLTHDAQFAYLQLNDEASCAQLRRATFEQALTQGYSYMGRRQRRDDASQERDKYLYSQSLVFALRECRASIAAKDEKRKTASFNHLARLINESLALKPHSSSSALWRLIGSLKQGIQQSLKPFTWITCERLFSKDRITVLESKIETKITQEERYARQQKALMETGTPNIPVFSGFRSEHFDQLQTSLSSIQADEPLWAMKQRLNSWLSDRENNTRPTPFLVNAKELADLTYCLQHHTPALIIQLQYHSHTLLPWKTIAENRQRIYSQLTSSKTTLSSDTKATAALTSFNTAFASLKEALASQPTSSKPSEQWANEYRNTAQHPKDWLSRIPGDLTHQKHQICFSQNNATQLTQMTQEMEKALMKIEELLKDWTAKSAPSRVLCAEEIERQLACIATLKAAYIRFFNTEQECFLPNDSAGKNLSYFRALGFTYQKLTWNTEGKTERQKRHLEQAASLISCHSCGLPSLTLATIKSHYQHAARSYHPDKNTRTAPPEIHCLKVNLPGQLNAYREAILTSPELPPVAFLDINGQPYYAIKALGLLTPVTLSAFIARNTRRSSEPLTFTASLLTDEMKTYHQTQYWRTCFQHINEAYAQIKTQTEALTLSASEEGITSNFAYSHDAFLSAQLQVAREQFQARLSEFAERQAESDRKLAEEKAERERDRLEADRKLAALEAQRERDRLEAEAQRERDREEVNAFKAMVVALMQQQGITPTPEAAAVSSSVAVSQDKEVPQNVSLGAHRNTVFSSSGSRAASPQETDETAQKHASDELEISP